MTEDLTYSVSGRIESFTLVKKDLIDFFDFDTKIINLAVLKILEFVDNFDLSRLSNTLFSPTKDLMATIEVSFGEHELVEDDSIQKQIVLIFASESGKSEISKSSNIFAFSRYSNLFFFSYYRFFFVQQGFQGKFYTCSWLSFLKSDSIYSLHEILDCSKNPETAINFDPIFIQTHMSE